MASVNLVVEAGNLTKDPELRYTREGTAVASFTLAVSRRGSEKTDYFSVTCWRGLAGRERGRVPQEGLGGDSLGRAAP